ncbi:MAG: hypothetical protein ACI835_005988, partial [Planctomycetota bacterium]
FVVITEMGHEESDIGVRETAREYLIKDANLLERLPSLVNQLIGRRAQSRRLAYAEQILDLYAAALKQATDALAILAVDSAAAT